MPGRSVIITSSWFFRHPSFFSTVTPGKFPTWAFEPVSLLKSEVLPEFWLPASAKLILPLMGFFSLIGSAGISPNLECSIISNLLYSLFYREPSGYFQF